MNILSLPVTNTDAEHLFSKSHLVKTDMRNRLNLESAKALCYVSEAVQEQGNCFSFKPHVAMMNCTENKSYEYYIYVYICTYLYVCMFFRLYMDSLVTNFVNFTYVICLNICL